MYTTGRRPAAIRRFIALQETHLMTRHVFALAMAHLAGPSVAGIPLEVARTPLRWSADSDKLLFDWRKPGETESSTYAVGRDGGEPRKLSDDEVRSASSANGRWDKAHRRILLVDGGDVVLVDSTRGTRRQITRTTGAESNPRWAPDSVRLVQRLIELKMENWTFAPYPVENHSFTEASSWADEYRRILELFEDDLRTPHNGKAT